MGRVLVAIIGGCVVDLAPNGRSGKVLLGHWVEGVRAWGCKVQVVMVLLGL